MKVHSWELLYGDGIVTNWRCAGCSYYISTPNFEDGPQRPSNVHLKSASTLLVHFGSRPIAIPEDCDLATVQKVLFA